MQYLDCGTLWACSDCVMLIAYDDATDDHRVRFADWQAGYGDGATLVLADAHEVFATSRCDGCGSTRAGDRHEIVAFV